MKRLFLIFVIIFLSSYKLFCDLAITDSLIINAHKNTIYSLCLSPNEKMIASCSWNEASTVKIWDTDNGELLKELKNFADKYYQIRKINWLNDNLIYLHTRNSRTDKHRIEIWNINQENIVDSMNFENEIVYSQINSEKSKLAVIEASLQNLIYIIDLSTFKIINKITNETDSVSILSWSNDNIHIAAVASNYSVSRDTVLRIFNSIDGSILKKISLISLENIDWNPKNNRIAFNNSKVYVYDLDSGKIVSIGTKHIGWVSRVKWDKSGEKILTGGNNGMLSISDSKNGNVIYEHYVSGIPFEILWNKDNSKIICGTWMDGNIVIYTINEINDVIEINNSNVKFNSFPNPASNVITLESSISLGQVVIYDILGLQVWKGEFRDNIAEIDINILPPGIYFLSAAGQRKMFVKE